MRQEQLPDVAQCDLCDEDGWVTGDLDEDGYAIARLLIASGATTQSVDTVFAVLSAHRNGASINAAAKASGINYRTAQRIVEAAAERRQGLLVAAS